jgi:hypothetical protein
MHLGNAGVIWQKKLHVGDKITTCNKGGNNLYKSNLRCFNGNNPCNYYIPWLYLATNYRIIN